MQEVDSLWPGSNCSPSGVLRCDVGEAGRAARNQADKN